MQQPEIERLARRFHEVYEQLAPQFGWKTQEKSAVAWSDLPEENRKLMIATVGVVMSEIETEHADAQRMEFDRNHWQRKVGVLLSLIERHVKRQRELGVDAKPLSDAANRAVNTNWYTQSQSEPIADIARMTVENTIKTAVDAGYVLPADGHFLGDQKSNGAG